MNKFYLIIPGTLLGVFLFFYNGALKEMKAKEVAAQVEKDRKNAEEAVRKAEIEKKATEDATERQRKRDEEDRAKEEKKRHDYQEIINVLTRDVNSNTAATDKYAKEAADLELQINAQRNRKEKLNTETFDLAKQVERAKIERRNAELEIQRMVEMVAKKVGESSLTNIPPPPPPSK
ncbi:MAG: hypothetical protein HY302_02985 [Opitutae bacterium]|nr:hypothetical protein [Opitutae bacterium]